MSEIAAPTGLRDGATAVVDESYSFACMRCGHGWEQSYEIEHHTDAHGHTFVRYVADGRIVPSPLNRPRCRHCDGRVVRIMRPGQVSSARDAARPARHRAAPAGPVEPPRPAAGTEAPGRGGEPGAPGEHRPWHLSGLLHPFHRKAGRAAGGTGVPLP
ncbi:hypothetical protein ACIF8T_13650 [Streptomyces sp. NPDC085946]|uniref:hypothetical protein n=1 Tax=Streptomyces sp. NPDC085946 TaxID=3365744 RepID=UPI0037D92467